MPLFIRMRERHHVQRDKLGLLWIRLFQSRSILFWDQIDQCLGTLSQNVHGNNFQKYNTCSTVKPDEAINRRVVMPDTVVLALNPVSSKLNGAKVKEQGKHRHLIWSSS